MTTNKITIEITNGVTLYRRWDDMPELEFMAAFQYDTNGKEWAEALLAQESTEDWRGAIIMFNHYDGTARQFTKTTAADESEA